MHTSFPSTAILRMHDRDWVYFTAPENKFRRVEVISGNSLPNGMRLESANEGTQIAASQHSDLNRNLL